MVDRDAARPALPHPPETLTGDRVVLRRAVPADARALFDACDDPEVMRFLDWPRPQHVSDTLAHLENAIAAWNDRIEFQWVVIERATGDLAGTISARPRGHAVDFGYFLGREYWGRGLAADAARLLVAWLREQPAVLRIWATADAENDRSRRVLERVGLRLEGVMRMAGVRPNIGPVPRDTALYAWCRGDPLVG